MTDTQLRQKILTMLASGVQALSVTAPEEMTEERIEIIREILSATLLYLMSEQ